MMAPATSTPLGPVARHESLTQAASVLGLDQSHGNTVTMYSPHTEDETASTPDLSLSPSYTRSGATDINRKADTSLSFAVGMPGSTRAGSAGGVAMVAKKDRKLTSTSSRLLQGDEDAVETEARPPQLPLSRTSATFSGNANPTGMTASGSSIAPDVFSAASNAGPPPAGGSAKAVVKGAMHPWREETDQEDEASDVSEPVSLFNAGHANTRSMDGGLPLKDASLSLPAPSHKTHLVALTTPSAVIAPQSITARTSHTDQDATARLPLHAPSPSAVAQMSLDRKMPTETKAPSIEHSTRDDLDFDVSWCLLGYWYSETFDYSFILL